MLRMHETYGIKSMNHMSEAGQQCKQKSRPQWLAGSAHLADDRQCCVNATHDVARTSSMRRNWRQKLHSDIRRYAEDQLLGGYNSCAGSIELIRHEGCESAVQTQTQTRPQLTQQAPYACTAMLHQ
jgi:hypothetical protein